MTALYELLLVFYMMPSLLTIPAEIRLQIYHELIIPHPGSTRLGPPTSGPIICYRNHSFHTGILRVCKNLHAEAIAEFLKEVHSTLYIYLVFNGDKPCGSDAKGHLGQALKTLANSDQLQNVRTCIIDIRISRPKAHERASIADISEVLSFTVEELQCILSDAPALQKVEVAWLNQLRKDMTRIRGEALQPLLNLPADYALVMGKDREQDGRQPYPKWQIADWPEMLKPYRNLDF